MPDHSGAMIPVDQAAGSDGPPVRSPAAAGASARSTPRAFLLDPSEQPEESVENRQRVGRAAGIEGVGQHL